MAPSRIRKALGAVKDQTSIGLAKVSSTSNAESDLEVAVVKATRHDDHPAEEKHIREILSLTCYSRQYVTACVNTIARRLTKTRSWTVALKSLVLVHRLLIDGDPSYEQEVFFATRRGTRLLNMSDFRDTSRSDSWDFSAFVRTFARYLDERLEYRVQGRRDRKGRRSRSRSFSYDEDSGFDLEEGGSVGGGGAASSSASSTPGRLAAATPVRELRTERIFNRAQHLQRLLERFLACRPTGAAKSNRIVAVALYPLVKESHQIYYDLADIVAILVDRFADLDVPDCVKVHDIFSRLSKQLDELDSFYSWCKSAGIARSSDYPDIDHITQKKLDVIDEFIRDKSTLLSHATAATDSASSLTPDDVTDHVDHDPEPDMNAIKALPAPDPVSTQEERLPTSEESVGNDDGGNTQLVPLGAATAAAEEEEVDFLSLKGDPTVTVEDHAGNLALALFDGPPAGPDGGAAGPPWEAFSDDDQADWETALVQSASTLPHQKPSLGGGLDLLTLDGMYQLQPQVTRPTAFSAGSASSIAFPAGRGGQGMLALPAPPGSGRNGEDPFAASAMVAPPAYVQMADMENKQRLLVEEQEMWQQYAKEGMQGAASMEKVQANPYAYYHHQQQQRQPRY